MGLPKGRAGDNLRGWNMKCVQLSILCLWVFLFIKTHLPVDPKLADSSYCLQVALTGQDLATPWWQKKVSNLTQKHIYKAVSLLKSTTYPTYIWSGHAYCDLTLSGRPAFLAKQVNKWKSSRSMWPSRQKEIVSYVIVTCYVMTAYVIQWFQKQDFSLLYWSAQSMDLNLKHLYDKMERSV